MLQYKSKHEGDLVAKCYFAKHKLVWEVLDGSLKNKMEIQWSDVVAIKANYPDDGPATLDVVVIYLFTLVLFFLELKTGRVLHICYYALYMIELILRYCNLSWCSLLGRLFSLGRRIHNLESIPCGRQQQILLMGKLA